LSLVRRELGERWLKPSLFRIGASALLAAIDVHLAAAFPLEMALNEMASGQQT
jgi:hypothetical protein